LHPIMSISYHTYSSYVQHLDMRHKILTGACYHTSVLLSSHLVSHPTHLHALRRMTANRGAPALLLGARGGALGAWPRVLPFPVAHHVYM